MAKNNSISPKSVRPTPKTTPRTTASASSLDALETPVIAPEFCGTLAEQVSQTLYIWLKQNAPAEVYTLFNFEDSLSDFEQEAQHHKGLVTAESNRDISDIAIRCINVIAVLGGTFSGPCTVSIARKAKVGVK